MFQVFASSRKAHSGDHQLTAFPSGSSNGEAHARHVHVAILGAAFSGLGMAIRLKQHGQQDFLVLERAADIGGTWPDNTYPGCACDIPSPLYACSLALH